MTIGSTANSFAESELSVNGFPLPSLTSTLSPDGSDVSPSDDLTGIFLIGYGLTRFMVEWVRQPDAQFQTLDNPIGYALQLGSTGLTMGQILTLPMLLAGLWLIQKARARQ